MDEVNKTYDENKILRGTNLTGRLILDALDQMKPMKHNIHATGRWKRLKLWMRKKCYRISTRVRNKDSIGSEELKVIFKMKPNWMGKIMKYPEYEKAYMKKGNFSGDGWTQICASSKDYYVSKKMQFFLNEILTTDRKRKKVGL